MKDENPPAFPRPDTDHGSYGYPGHDGMTLRDWFASQMAPQVLLMIKGKDKPSAVYAYVAEQSYAFADAMLAHRQKGQCDADS